MTGLHEQTTIMKTDYCQQSTDIVLKKTCFQRDKKFVTFMARISCSNVLHTDSVILKFNLQEAVFTAPKFSKRTHQCQICTSMVNRQLF